MVVAWARDSARLVQDHQNRRLPLEVGVFDQQETWPSASSALVPLTREVAGSAALLRMSATRPGAAPETSTLQRSFFQAMLSIATAAPWPASGRVTVISGVRRTPAG